MSAGAVRCPLGGKEGRQGRTGGFGSPGAELGAASGSASHPDDAGGRAEGAWRGRGGDWPGGRKRRRRAEVAGGAGLWAGDGGGGERRGDGGGPRLPPGGLRGPRPGRAAAGVLPGTVPRQGRRRRRRC